MDDRIENALSELDDLLEEVRELGEGVEYMDEDSSDASSFTVNTPFGKFEVDLEEFAAKKKAANEKVNLSLIHI